jgi:ubiquinone/menaquinone biosynthesis C-methylase UbiE
MTLDPDIDAHYRLGFEQGRLRGGATMEFVRTWELLERYLPAPPARVLDVGGGPGTYAIPLAEAGYGVHLVDPVALHVAQTGPSLAGAVVGDARSLPFEDAGADAVLLLGPLYHLIEAEDRAQALREAARVLRPGGVVAAAAISRFASTYDGIARGFVADPRAAAMVEGDVRDGVHRNPEPDEHPEWFTTAYFHRPEELRAELETAGLAVEAVLAIEGAASFRPELDAVLADPERREAILAAVRRVEAEPSLTAASAHFMAVGRAP